MNHNGTDTRRRVFLAIVNDGGALTPTEIGDAIGERRQKVTYHLNKLVDTGLIVRDNGTYRAQPLFTDESFEAEFVELLSELVPKVEAHLLLDPETDGQEQTTVVFNCLRMYVTMVMLESPADATP